MILFFSEKRQQRLLRHLLFWVVWWLYFSICFHLYAQPAPGNIQPLYITLGDHLIIKTFFLILIDAVTCYTFIYFLLPKIISGRLLIAFAIFLLLYPLLFVSAYFLYWNVFPLVDSLFGDYKPNSFITSFWPAFSLGWIDTLKVVAAAAIIKYVKYWWLKEKENKQVESEKIITELQLLKAQIHPGILFNALNNIYVYSLAASPKAPELLLKLSNLLSYMLYECDQQSVPLEKEIEMMKDYIALEKIRLDNAVEMQLSVQGEMKGKCIAPFLLLPFIENSFKQSSDSTEPFWINMDITIKGYSFTMKLANGTTSESMATEIGLADVQKRLSLIYPQQHELKVNREPEMLTVVLNVQLAESDFTPVV